MKGDANAAIIVPTMLMVKFFSRAPRYMTQLPITVSAAATMIANLGPKAVENPNHEWRWYLSTFSMSVRKKMARLTDQENQRCGYGEIVELRIRDAIPLGRGRRNNTWSRTTPPNGEIE